MQPRNLLAAAGAELELEDVAAGADVDDEALVDGVLLTLDVLLPQAASSRLATAAAAVVTNAVCFTVSSTGPRLLPRAQASRGFPPEPRLPAD